MSTPTVGRFARPSPPPFGNGLGLLLHEQRALRRAHPDQTRAGALSPLVSLRRRVHAAAVVR